MPPPAELAEQAACKRCGEGKPFDAEHFVLKKDRGRRYLLRVCRDCMREYNRGFRDKDKDAARAKRWKSKNRERINERERERRAADPGYRERSQMRQRVGSMEPEQLVRRRARQRVYQKWRKRCQADGVPLDAVRETIRIEVELEYQRECARLKQEAPGWAEELRSRARPIAERSYRKQSSWERSKSPDWWEHSWKARIRASGRERELRELAAPLPVEVVLPYLHGMLGLRALEADPAGNMGLCPKMRETDARYGINRLAAEAGINPRSLSRIMDDPACKSAALNVCDRLAMVGDFTLEELTDRAREWALLTGDPWPYGYLDRG